MDKPTRFDLDEMFVRFVASRHDTPVPVANYHKPNIARFSCSILVPEDFVWHSSIFNYWDEGIYRNPFPHSSATMILHGHPFTQWYCLGDDFCHVYGYAPTGKESPRFLKGFYEKWPYLKPKFEQLEIDF